MDAKTRNYLKRRQTEIAHRLREARAKQGWSQEQLAELLGCSRAKLNRVENGRAELTMTEIDLVARVFKVKVDYFLSPRCRQPLSNSLTDYSVVVER